VNDALAETIAEGFEIQQVPHVASLIAFLAQEALELEMSLDSDLIREGLYVTYQQFENGARTL